MFDPFLWYIVPGYYQNDPRWVIWGTAQIPHMGNLSSTLYCTLYKFSLAILDAGSLEGAEKTQGFYPRRSRIKPLPSSQTSVAGRPSVALVDAPRAVKRQLPKGWGSLRSGTRVRPPGPHLGSGSRCSGIPAVSGKSWFPALQNSTLLQVPRVPPESMLHLLGASERWKPAQPRPEIQPGTFWLKTRRDRVCCCASSLVFRVLNPGAERLPLPPKPK